MNDNMTKFLKEIEVFGFKKTCSIIKGPNHPLFDGLMSDSETGIVYLWIANNPPRNTLHWFNKLTTF